MQHIHSESKTVQDLIIVIDTIEIREKQNLFEKLTFFHQKT